MVFRQFKTFPLGFRKLDLNPWHGDCGDLSRRTGIFNRDNANA